MRTTMTLTTTDEVGVERVAGVANERDLLVVAVVARHVGSFPVYSEWVLSSVKE